MLRIPTVLHVYLSKSRILCTSWNRLQGICGRRSFLSDAFRCQEAWEKRLEAPILQKVRLDEMYNELNRKYLQDGIVSAIDVDVFANAVHGEDHSEEMQDLLHKLRMGPNTGRMLPSTPHAAIRLLLDMRNDEQLLSMLDDRLNYGVFPDNYSSVLLMDTFLKDNKFTEAARVGALQMLQEDWSDPLVSHLALYSCVRELEQPGQWPQEEKEEDTGEEIKVRVKFIRNPFFDDHFDLRDPRLLLGKTLAEGGSAFPDSVGKSCRLLGLVLYRKWDKARRFAESLKGGAAVLQSVVKQVEELLIQEQSEEGADNRNQLLAVLPSLTTCDGDLSQLLTDRVKKAVEASEAALTAAQCDAYVAWEQTRESELRSQAQALDRARRLAIAQQKKEELAATEQTLFFFDNEEKWELEIEKKQEELKQQEPLKRKEKKTADEENYVPPEV